MFLALLFLLNGTASFPPAADRIPVLLVSGANNHDWEWTAPSLQKILEQSEKFTVTRTDRPGEYFAAEDLGAFQAVVLDYNGPRWGSPAEERFLEAVQQGLGVVVVHAANNAFPGWVEYEKLVGLCWREGTGHGRFHAFDVVMNDRNHPITATLPDLRAHPDELYHRLVAMHGVDNHVLATALSAADTGGTGDHEPMLVVRRFGEGRMFHTPLGHVWRNREHTKASHRDPQFHAVVVRGTEWAATGSVRDGAKWPNHLNSLERRAGWELLFDGSSAAGWQRIGTDAFPTQGWAIVNGCLRHAHAGKGGDLITSQTFADFELEFEWSAAHNANSGVKYRVKDAGAVHMLGPEYQVLGAGGVAVGAPADTLVGALYDLQPASAVTLAAPGSFQSARIVARDSRVEHWLNDHRLLTVDLDSSHWQNVLQNSKFRQHADFARNPGVLGLQDHGGEVWYRSLRIRDWNRLPGQSVQLLGDDLTGWRSLGDARYTVEPGVGILGEIGGGAQSFLVTEKEYGDFLFEVDVKTELPGNSGIQIRSHQRDNGGLYGYQIEIDPSDRAWSGGLYDEGRRGWLQDLENNPAGRRAFQHGEWNRYRIQCVGPWIQVRVNGVLTADYFDFEDLIGLIGLQVHSGNNTRVRWHHLRLQDFGRHRWRDLLTGQDNVIEIPGVPEWEYPAQTIGFWTDQPPIPGWSFVGKAWQVKDDVLRVRAGDRPATARSLLAYEDVSLRFDLLLEARARPEITLRIPELDRGVLIDLNSTQLRTHLRNNEWQRLAMGVYGHRLHLHIGGQPIQEWTLPRNQASGPIQLTFPPGSIAQLRNLAVLEPAAAN
jgi:type 1 glutamine amidotransferase